MHWQSCQMQTAAFLICPALFKGPSSALTFAMSQSGISTELGLAALKY